VARIRAHTDGTRFLTASCSERQATDSPVSKTQTFPVQLHNEPSLCPSPAQPSPALAGVAAGAGLAGVVLCDDAASVLHAVAGIRDAGACVLDCEGTIWEMQQVA
jgi:hypothetical protein